MTRMQRWYSDAYFFRQGKDPYLKHLPDGRIISANGRRAWYLKTHRFIEPLPRGRVWLKHWNEKGWLL